MDSDTSARRRQVWLIICVAGALALFGTNLQLDIQSKCGLASSLIDSRLTNSIVFGIYACSVGLFVLVGRAALWTHARYATAKRIAIALIGVGVFVAGMSSWAEMNFRCHGS